MNRQSGHGSVAARVVVWLLTAAIGCPSGVAAQAAPAGAARTVTLSLTEYNRLVDLSSRSATSPAPPPVAAVVSSAMLRTRVDDGLARGSFELAGVVLGRGTSRVTLLEGATLLSASTGGRALPLVVEGAAHAALLNGPGPFEAALEWGAPVTFAPGRASFTLPVPAAGAVRASVDVPGEQAELRLSSGLITSRTSAGGRTTVEATLVPGAAVEVSWSLRDSAPVAAARETRTLVDILSLLTLGEADVRLATLVDVTLVQGEPRSFELQLPEGYELATVTGSSIETTERRAGRLLVTVTDPAARRHQFLLSLERPHGGGSFALETALVSLADAQRERGDVAIEAVGTLELELPERPGMQRVDVRELNQALRSLARLPILAGLRYHRAAAAQPRVAVDVRRFADAGVLAASIDHAQATTLVTVEGRALTEVVLRLRNRAQPFLKVDLPEGASMVSVEVAGQTAKPVTGPDGTRVPLLRNGFRPTGPYQVSFVYIHAGVPFASKGDLQMSLPRLDVPIGLVDWELFAPDRYRMQTIGGNVIDREVIDRAVRKRAEAAERERRAAAVAGGAIEPVPPPVGRGSGLGPGVGGGTGGGAFVPVANGGRVSLDAAGVPGNISGRVVDPGGAVLPGTQLLLQAGSRRQTAVADGSGTFQFLDVPAGPVTITATLSGFIGQRSSFTFDRRARSVEFTLRVAAVGESVAVTAAAPALDAQMPSQNVLNLQRRASGVLPIRMDVPRAGTSYRFVKPLVVHQEPTVMLRYRRR